MMKTINIFVLLLFFLSGFSQNLIDNGSFEKIKKCPEDLGEFDKVSDWYNPGKGTPDLFSSCFKTGKNKMSVPKNYIGTQAAKEGEAYVGIIAYSQRSKNYREYLGQKLHKKLVKDSVYKVSFFISLSENSNFAVSTIGLFFSEEEIENDSWCVIERTPQVKTEADNVLNEKAEWIEISGIYVAKGEERYLAIGNFCTDENSHLKNVQASQDGKPSQKAYYYIDHVSIVLCPSGKCELVTEE